MAISLPESSAKKDPAVSPQRPPAASSRTRPLRDNTALLLAGVGVLIAVLVGLLALASRSATLAPDFLTEVVLYALSATNLTILVALAFVLARNIVKLLVEKRRGLPFAHFRAKLVAVLLGMTLIPALLVLLVGSGLIRNSIDRWFNAPMDDVLSSANAIAGDHYEERQRLVEAQAGQLARALAAIDVSASSEASVRAIVEPDVLQERVSLVEVYRVEASGSSDVPRLVRVVEIGSASLASPAEAGSAERLAAGAAAGMTTVPVVERLADGGDLIRSAVPIRESAGATLQGVVIASEYVTGQFAARARRMTEAYEDYQQLRVLQRPLAGVYLSFFFMLTLMILVGSTWMGLYLAKRITRPVQMLAVAANEIGAGHFEHRVEAETRDEFGSLIDAFNRMASDLSASRRRLERSAIDLEQKHQDVEGRRRYVETILQRIATGVVSVDTAGNIRTMNAAASRLLGVTDGASGQPAATVFGTPELRPLAAVMDETAEDRTDALPQEVSITRDGRDVHLAVMTTRLRREDGVSDGVVLVLEDVTPLIRAQRVAAWREVARSLAHEIKNPLTPIQLCAERMQRHFAGASEPTRALVDECAATIVGEVESLKGLVDEFSQFARMPSPRTEPTDIHVLLTDVFALYRGIFTAVDVRPRFAEALPQVSVDPEQIRRVVINLIDNAVEAMAQRGIIDVETHHVPVDGVIRIVVADNGPGIPPDEREKLFLPHYSTKQRGSGLGLAIVRRIVTEHGGSVSVTENLPHGTRFVIELPC